MAPMFDTRLPSIDAIRAAPVYLRYSPKSKVLMDGFTARAILACYDALGPEGRAKFERMIARNPAQLHRVASFCFARVSTAGIAARS